MLWITLKPITRKTSLHFYHYPLSSNSWSVCVPHTRTCTSNTTLDPWRLPSRRTESSREVAMEVNHRGLLTIALVKVECSQKAVGPWEKIELILPGSEKGFTWGIVLLPTLNCVRLKSVWGLSISKTQCGDKAGHRTSKSTEAWYERERQVSHNYSRLWMSYYSLVFLLKDLGNNWELLNRREINQICFSEVCLVRLGSEGLWRRGEWVIGGCLYCSVETYILPPRKRSMNRKDGEGITNWEC